MKVNSKKLIVALFCLFFGWLLGTGGLFLTLMLGGLGCLVWLFFFLILPFFINHHHWKLMSSTFLAISFWLLSAFGFMVLKSSYNNHSKTQLLTALAAYKNKVGTYPIDLKKLTPEYYYFSPSYIGEWRLYNFDYVYFTDRDEFVLQYSSDGFVLEYYESEIGYWNSTSGIS